MVVSLSNIPKDSQVYRFITSGKRGRCSLCSRMVEKLEAHHVCYSPQITIKLCHNCHHKVHFWPQRLSEPEKLKLLSARFNVFYAHNLLSKKILTPISLAKLIAPSRNAFIHAHQRITKSSHLKKIIKFNKEVDLRLIKHARLRKVK